MLRRPPRTTLFPTRRSSDLPVAVETDLADRERRRGVVADPRDALVHRARRDVARVRLAHRVHVRKHGVDGIRSEEHTSELQSRRDLVCRLLLEKKKKKEQNT